eukprot:scaffold113240_cov25-Prasinocladus_malaysianus.AAC.1
MHACQTDLPYFASLLRCLHHHLGLIAVLSAELAHYSLLLGPLKVPACGVPIQYVLILDRDYHHAIMTQR